MNRLKCAVGLVFGTCLLAACDPNTTSTGSVAVGTSFYYDSMLWNDYYHRPPLPPPPGPRPRPPRPPHPGPGPKPPHPHPLPHPMPHPHPPIHRLR